MSQIGNPKEKVTVAPIETPVPEKTPVPATEPEKVPAKDA